MKDQPRQKSRHNWRSCHLCTGQDKYNDGPDNPLLRVCNCNSPFAHYKCVAKLMEDQGKIHCNRCKAQFESIQYSYSKRGFWKYIWEETRAKASLATALSMMLSLLFTIGSIIKTCCFELEPLLEELIHFRYNFNKDSNKQLLDILMKVHVKMVLPLLSFYLGYRNLSNFVCDFFEWQKTHFSVTVQPAPVLARFSRTKAQQEGKQS